MIARRSLPLLLGACSAEAQTGATRTGAARRVAASGGPRPSITLEGPSAEGVLVFGHPFRRGDIGRGAGLRADAGGSGALPVQMDVTTRHADGSVQHAVIALRIPALRQGQSLPVSLLVGPEVGAPLSPARAAEGRSARVEVGGFVVDALAGQGGWQVGPLAARKRVEVDVPADAAGGATSLRLVLDVALHADGALVLDTWFRNDLALRPGVEYASYELRVSLDGREAMAGRVARHHPYAGWGRLVSTRPIAAHIRFDPTYLADAAAAHRYDLGTGVAPQVLDGFARAMAAPSWTVPLDPRGITQRMHTGGARADIGPAPLPVAAWVISQDRRATRFVLGQAEAAGAIPWHFRDPQGGWIDTRRRPGFWTDTRARPPHGLTFPVGGDHGWAPDRAHQPDYSFMPWILTGRRAFLDNLTAQAHHSVIATWPGVRREGGLPDNNIVHNAQTRSAAWSMRQVDNAAWALGDQAGWVGEVSAANWAWLRRMLPEWTATQGEAHGWIPGEYGGSGVLPPWQQDYFVSTVAMAAKRGSADARAVLSWMENFLAGRFLARDRGFNPHDGCAYLIAISPPRGTPYRSWAEIGRETVARNLSNGEGWEKSRGDYGRWALQSLAALVEVLDTQASRSAYSWLLNSGAYGIDATTRARLPTLSIVPA
ncbi:hypothetical protein [Sabulicella glaciei]|uniref:Alpha-L-rhamnosidase six-hairpin glycosidase domain-containing protein n=1 Tax=Sabulicella glaciei TaxID=2984948 RepID=A0ABT3NRL4_9PROT|nr:hypothetical protein [Roseococcus sp. MDT2-1-1]MCW8084800.1 hypothetical protein [Roseococcus sp. MDT2-1-1]